MSKPLPTPLKRSTPNPTAPSTPSGLPLRIYNILTPLSILLFLPTTLLRTTFSHFRGVYPKSQSLRVSLLAQVIKLVLWSKYVLRLPEPHPAEWGVCKPLTALGGKARRGMGCERVVLGPVGGEWVAGIADFGEEGGPKGVERPGWMIWPLDDDLNLNSAGGGNSVETRLGGQGGNGRYDGGVGLEEAREGEKIVLYFHSGAYLFGHALESAFPWSTSRELNMRVFAMNYRKTLTASTAHPAPLLDALASYLYLTQTLHFNPKNIIITGDSAGGHLTLLLSRYIHYLSSLGRGISLPGYLCLCSPWCDLTSSSRQHNFPSQKENYKTDYVSFLGDLGVPSGMRWYAAGEARNGWFSPVLAGVEGWKFLNEGGEDPQGKGVKVFVMYGTKEMLADEVQVTVDCMREAGVDVRLKLDVDGMHIGPAMRWPGSNAWEKWIEGVKGMITED